MVELLDLSDASLSQTDPSESTYSFRTSTPRRDVMEPPFKERPNVSGVSIRLSSSPPPLPKTPKPQTAVTKSTAEDSGFCVADKNLRKISSARELLRCWTHEINGPKTPITKSAVLLKRRHSEIIRRCFTTSIKADQRSLNIVSENDLTNLHQCTRTCSPTSQNSSEMSRQTFFRNSPTRKARRSRLTSLRNVVRETTSDSSVKENTSNQLRLE